VTPASCDDRLLYSNPPEPPPFGPPPPAYNPAVAEGVAEAGAEATAEVAAEETALAVATGEGAGVLAAIPVAGWIALGVIAVGVGGYLIYRAVKSSDNKPDSDPGSTQTCPLASGGTPAPQPAPVPASAATSNKPVMDPNLSPADQELWQKCSQLHDTYKNTQSSVANRASRIKELADRLSQNKGSPQDKVDLCLLLDEQIEEAQRLHRQRKEFTDNGCDKFDWFNQGTTEAERRAAHEGEMANVDKQIKNLFALKNRFCP
jgi:hypothetical protein